MSRVRSAFAAAGIAEPALDARILLLDASAIDATELAIRPERPVGEAGAERILAHARRRLAGEPVWRILGEREFWGLTFWLSPDTLVPRPDSETAVEAALRALPRRDAPARVLDLGTGTGCLLVAVLHERPEAFGIGLDRSPGAAMTARRNAVRNGVGDRAALIVGDWAGALSGRFDLVISNPPYIPAPDLAGLAREVREHDPRAALDGGADGLDAYRAILADAPRLLAPGGALVLEIGIGQADDVGALAFARGLRLDETRADLGGIPRALTFR
ncbi:peptide chain release factor N(5)-glutamine methyltransferase [Salinarimonas soli]|uniref:Release factor glutamine methyltransferase n=1 Tax=Salinarimonas soli TaxID=1638099 RepID=A0A5B2V6D4_9HYPH|nr:peptide chain release factor N(5)-glutamine methyltransferase [Salinarimonas soli]